MVRAAIGQLALGQRPNPFVGVEFRSIGREMLQLETRVLIQKLLQRLPLMSGGIIQQNDNGATQVPQQLLQKPTDFLLPDVVEKEEIIESQVVAPGAYGNS